MRRTEIFTEKTREMLGEKFAELANIIAGALIFGQALSDKFNLTIMVWGLALALTCYFASILIHP